MRHVICTLPVMPHFTQPDLQSYYPRLQDEDKNTTDSAKPKELRQLSGLIVSS